MRRQSLEQRGQALATLAGLVTAVSAILLFAYNPLQDNVNGQTVPARWDNATATWGLFPTIGSNVDNPSAAASAVAAATNTWTTTPLNGSRLNNLTMTQATANAQTPSDPDLNVADCVNVISFSPSSAISFPTGAIAFTAVTTQTAPTGTTPFNYQCKSGPTTTTNTCHLLSCIIDADMVFNPKEQFSTTTPAAANSFDVQSIATHEFGHFIGLDHSGIAHAIMYPFGDTGSNGVQHNLAIDDTIGVAFLYPTPAFFTALGSISGTISQNGSGIFAAHIVLTDATTGAAVVDGLSNPNGTYSRFVPPGTYTVAVIPLAVSANSGVYTLSDFGGWYCGYSENSVPCCDPKADPTCTGTPITNPTNFTGKFF